jgi:hypothetical protein
VPLPSASWPEIERFARTFHGFRHFADCAKVANRAAEAFRVNGLIPSHLGLSDLRACLFFEQRRWAHLGEGRPSREALGYIRTLVAAIRTKLRLRRGGGGDPAADAAPPRRPAVQ